MRVVCSAALQGIVLALASTSCTLDRAGVAAGMDAAVETPDGAPDAEALDGPIDAPAPIDAPPDGGPCTSPIAGAVVASPAGAIVLDGDLAEWPDQAFVEVDGWGGGALVPAPDDHHVRFAVAWTSNELFLGIEVVDDVLDGDASNPSMLWRGDSVQVGLDMARNAVGPGYDATDDYELGWALVDGALTQHRWQAPDGASDPSGQVAIGRAGAVTIYEVALFAGELGRADFSAGLVVRMGLLVNESDGAAREGWAEWGSGIGEVKDPSLFRDLTLAPDPPCP